MSKLAVQMPVIRYAKGKLYKYILVNEQQSGCTVGKVFALPLQRRTR
jgi:hypothetical protein